MIQRVAGAEPEWLGGMVEGGKRNDPSDRTRFLHRQQRTDLRTQGCIAPDHLRLRAERRQILGKPLLEQGPFRIGDRGDERLARIEPEPAQRLFRQRLHLRLRAAEKGR